MKGTNQVYESMLSSPHLLVVGATGSGKSVLINALLFTLLQKSPDEIQLILIDPKRVELSAYRDCPHSFSYASEPKLMVQQLKDVVALMDDRYRIMQEKGIKDWDQFQIYIIIDEYADLIDVSKREAENALIRLAQLGRAAGIHIIAATQNCTTKVINTRIKSNFPCRVVLKTAFAYESRNVIGKGGAEELPKHGKGYFLSGNDCSLVDIEMISKDKINEQIEKWKDTPKPMLIKNNDVNDEIINKLIAFTKGKAIISIPGIESEFNISAFEASNYMKILEEKGYVESKEGSIRRRVIKND